MARDMLQGIAVSAGVAIGRAYFLSRREDRKDAVRMLAPENVAMEWQRFTAALEAACRDLEEAIRRLPAGLQDQSGILAAHLMICRDPKLLHTIQIYIQERLLAPEWAIQQAMADIARTFSFIEQSYFRERVLDARIVCNRIIGHLQGRRTVEIPGDEPCILLACGLDPVDTLALSPQRILGFITEEGGRTTHVGILARSMRVPAIVGVMDLEAHVADGDVVALDALRGRACINPTPRLLARYAAMRHDFAAFQQQVRAQALLPAELSGGRRVIVRGNIETYCEASGVPAAGGEGIGLYRTEFGFLLRNAMPEEEELYADYVKLAETMAPHKVVIRTLDVGADKMLGAQRALEEPNPALGMRAIRYCLQHQDIFRRQLRAVLRASVCENIALMFPMISGLMELRQAKAVLADVQRELRAARIPFNRDISLGMMIELPSAALMADALAGEVDFFSIGTNDLIQYCLGVDRDNRRVSHLYQPLHPAVIRIIKSVADVAHARGKPVNICGEMASDPYCLPLLLGMGIEEISMSPQAIPGIKHIIRAMDMGVCHALLQKALVADTAEKVNGMMQHVLEDLFPKELPFYISMLDSGERP